MSYSRTSGPSYTNLTEAEPLERVVVGGTERVLVRVRCFAGDLVKEQALQFSNADVLFVSDITEALAQKQGIQEQYRSFFSLWMVGRDLVLQLRQSQEIFEVVAKWHRWNEKYTHNPNCEDPNDPSNDFFFVYRREALLSIKSERRTNDDSVLRLLYGEAKHNVLTGVYPCKAEDAFCLAGIQTQIQYGNYDRQRHQRGFIISTLKELLPSYIVKAFPPYDIESKVFGEWVKHTGQDAALARLLYLQYCRQFPFYGATFFPACISLPPDGFFENRKERLLIGVNNRGISVIDMDKRKCIFHQEFSNISWSSTSDTITFKIKDMDQGINRGRSALEQLAMMKPNLKDEVMFITPQALLTNNVANKAILIAREENRELERVRKEQARMNKRRSTVTGSSSAGMAAARIDPRLNAQIEEEE